MTMQTPAAKRALIVIDVQNEYFTGGLVSEYPNPSMVLNNIGLAMDAARAAGMPVVVVQHTAPDGAPIFQKDQAEW
ncbi:MAG: isochorismatase family protein, partial [Burkholderiales bacterium]|nr:isochorismatase family protein [Burkholderiales bacterium]